MALHISSDRRILGGAVKRLREARDITQDALALGAEVHPAYLSNIERGKRQPSIEVITRIADRLGVSLDDISYEVFEGIDPADAVRHATDQQLLSEIAWRMNQRESVSVA